MKTNLRKAVAERGSAGDGTFSPMKKDDRRITLDPKEWRDAMRDIDAGPKLPSSTKAAADSAAAGKPKKPAAKTRKRAR